MKNFYKILTFISFPLLLFIVLEFFSRQLFLPHSDLPFKFDDFNRIKKEVEILFLGHSHFEKGINPQISQKPAFNLAYSAQDFYYHYKIFNKYADEMPELKVLYLSIDPFALTYDESVNSMFFVKDYFYFEKILPQNGFSFSFFLNSSVFWLNRGKFFKRLLHFDFKKEKYNHTNAENAFKINEQGQYLLSNGQRLAIGRMTTKALEKDAQHTIQRIISTNQPELLKKNTAYLKKIIQKATEKKIKVILVSAPVSNAYNQKTPYIVTKNTNEIVKNIIQKYPEVGFYDYSDLFSTNQNYFYNSDHLNKEGSIIFTKKLLETF